MYGFTFLRGYDMDLNNLDKVIGFKKQEILQLIQSYDSSFSFDEKTTDQQLNTEQDNICKTNPMQARIAELEQQLQAKDERIAELENETIGQSNELEKIRDEHGEHYAPDLAHAVNVWLELYANGKQKDDSHTNLVKQWINKNTGYMDTQDGYSQVEKRLQEITTPFKEWGNKRNKNHKK